MSMAACYTNILESSTVSLSQGAQNNSYPLYRLYDRDIGRMFAASALAALTVSVDQGANPLPVDTLIIPAGHNLSGAGLDLQCSDDCVAYTSVGAWTPADTNVIVKNFTPATHRYWRFMVENPASAPQFSELFLTSTYTWEKLPGRPGGPFDDVFNVKTDVTASGLDRFLIFGNSKRQRIYKIVNAGAAQQANILALNAAWRGAKPFWLYDHEGNWIFGKLAKPLNLKETGAGKFGFDFNFLEVLG
ncbi:MAG: hypothetical protein M0Z75_12060 [Nitrospiraceae bacterium]|nr:hypothetical protein [Nitrospiraceae bacterium]